eukprot:14590176-Alexandrium_andersonii.AAC.1
MSASLVGSEMCIRDRSPRSALARPYQMFESSGVSAEMASELMESMRSVSYTHLTLPTICSV